MLQVFMNYRYTAPKETSSYGILMGTQNVCLNKCNLYQKNVHSYTSLVNDFWTKMKCYWTIHCLCLI